MWILMFLRIVGTFLFETELKATHRSWRIYGNKLPSNKRRNRTTDLDKSFQVLKSDFTIPWKWSFCPLLKNIYKTRLFIVLEIPLRKNNLDQKTTSLMGPSIWNKLNNSLNISNTNSSFTNNYIKLVLKDMST